MQIIQSRELTRLHFNDTKETSLATGDGDVTGGDVAGWATKTKT